MNQNETLTEQQKVRALYRIIGERGLYVNTNADVFPEAPEEIALAPAVVGAVGGATYTLPLLKEGQQAYASPLLFATLTSLLNHGTLLVTGAPGIGKTTGAEIAGHFFTGTPLEDILASEIQGHPQLTEEKMVASYDIGKLVTTGEKVVIPTRFLQCPVKIIDEGNRIPADALSVIMRLVDTGKGVYGGTLLKAKHGPLTVTANYADEGTFQLTPPFLDRFDIAVMVASPPEWDLHKILQRGDEKLNGGLEEALRIPHGYELNFEKIRNEIKNLPEAAEYDVPAMSAFADFVYGSLRFSEAASKNLSRATKGNAWHTNQDRAAAGHFTNAPFLYTLNELSVRTAQAMPRYAKAFAWLNGDREATTQHLKCVLPYLLWHKIQPAQTALTEDSLYGNDRIAFVNALTTKIETEYTEVKATPEFKSYLITLKTLRTRKHRGKELSLDKLRTLAKNAILRIGQIDKPYGLRLAQQIAAEYNERVLNSRQESEHAEL